MKVIILPSKVSGTVTAPPSKSYSHRAIILASLAAGKSHIANALISDDTKTTINACKLLGAKIKLNSTSLEIEGVNCRFPKKTPLTINCGLSGTTIRLLTAISVLSPADITLTGEERLKQRPAGELVRVFKSLGINIKAENNQFPPIKIKGGNFPGGKIKISGEVSSQFISALLIIAPYAKKDTEITVSYLKSAPYVDITIELMKTFGIKVEMAKNKFLIKCGQHYAARNYKIEGDYSSVSYFFAANYVTDSNVNIENLKPDSVQGDKYFLELLKKLKSLKSQRSFDLGNYPDIVPTVAICAANTAGLTEITNIAHLRGKETDRIAAVAKGLQKMNIKTLEKEDALTIHGGKLKGATIDTYNDHRVAMTFAVAGLVAEGNTIINNAEVVNKSYPNFWKDLKSVGANITIIN